MSPDPNDVGLARNPEPPEDDDADEARDDYLSDLGFHGEED